MEATMDRVMEQSEFLKDVCKLVVYATELGYAVTGDAITSSHPARADRASARRASGTACAIDLHFFRRDRGAFTPAEENCSLEPLVDFWKSLSPQNRCASPVALGQPRFERRA
jgi:hypothetical protein